ncbi:hypothetical protein SLAV_26660 [Streptomyces lavendulae subsp. lavendulae]|uniref:Uncharacterized protein n=1 Tax=Streptomyces lavendulae subsp. lavendulae TaxID=58340 RepID=A0A2K8PK80_STRLA|nr:hypothetical protein SLAV_26660 [Streptomyces lavendulae subsp. lavendulae]QUQ56951.1 hypothetical protein SLLC_24800 [Streptomyces lavendulae subsp. lavendulae]
MGQTPIRSELLARARVGWERFINSSEESTDG